MRAPTSTEPPAGLVSTLDFITETEERELLAWISSIDFEQVVMHGRAARRTVRHFGYGYDFDARAAHPIEPIPAELLALRARCGELAEIEPSRLEEALVTRYPPGATIGWHRDAPMFGSKVVGVSLLGACRMRFQRGAREQRVTYELPLPPRSAYVLTGAARASWQHSIPAVKELRYSVTFRTVRRR